MFKRRGPQEAGPDETTLARGERAEDQALAHLQARGLRLLERHYRVAGGPSRRAGEIDLVMRERDGTIVFVEVRSRRGSQAGGAAASVTTSKQRSLVLAAQHYLMRWPSPPRCRFDVVAIDAGQLQWLRAAFDAA